MTLSQFFSILRARWGIALLILLTTVALAYAWIALRPANYTARAAVLVDVRSSDPVPGSRQEGMISPSYMATQIDIVGSARVAQRVVQMLQLDQAPEASQQWREATLGRGSVQEWLAGQLHSSLEVKPARESNIINITWSGQTPAEAARVANAFAQAYLDTSLELKTEPARRYAAWFEEQLAASRQNLEKAQGRLTAYQQRSGMVASAGLDYETARLNEISSQLTAIQGQTTDSRTKRGVSADSVAEVMQSQLINGLKVDISKLEAKIQESAANLGSSHPQMIRWEGELNSLRGKLTAETSRVTASINTAYQVGKGRERELQDALNVQKGRVMTINRQRDEYGLLFRDVESAQRAFETVSASAAQSRLQSLTTQTNLTRLTPAAEPLKPSGPSARQALIIATIGGGLLAVAGALMLELLRRRIRSAEDLSMATQLPVLASVPGNPRVFTRRLPPPRQLAIGHRSTA